MTRIKMKTISLMLLSLAATSAVASAATSAVALNDGGRRCREYKCAVAPEIDPAQGVSALLLLAGAVAILRARGGKKK